MGRNPYDFYRTYAAVLRHVIRARFHVGPTADQQLRAKCTIVAFCKDLVHRFGHSARVEKGTLNPSRISELVQRMPGVREVSRVRLRGSPTEALVDLVIQVSPTLNTAQAYAIARDIEQRIKAKLPGVVEVLVQIGPAPIERPTWKRVAQTVRLLADESRVGIHNLHVHKELDGSITVTLHAEVSADLTLAEAHTLIDAFEAKLRLLLPEVGAVVTHIEPVMTELEFERGAITHADELRDQVITCTEHIAGREACQSVTFHRIGRKITVTVIVTQPPDQAIRVSHQLAEAIRSAILAQHRQISAVVVHVEPARS